MKERDAEFRSDVWQGDDNRFFLTRSSRDLHRIDVCTYTIGEDSIVPIVKERMNTYQETRPIQVLGGGKEEKSLSNGANATDGHTFIYTMTKET